MEINTKARLKAEQKVWDLDDIKRRLKLAIEMVNQVTPGKRSADLQTEHQPVIVEIMRQLAALEMARKGK